jgi:hypothetical protein
LDLIGRGIRRAPVKPFFELHFGPHSVRPNEQKTAHWSAGNIHQPGVRLRNRLVVLIVADTRDKIILVDAAAHCTVHHETEAAEHPFFDRIMAHQTFAYPFCQLLVECHNLSFLRPNTQFRTSRVPVQT